MRYLGILLVIVVLSTSISAAVTVYVAPDGDDAANGSEDSPFQTLAQARNALRDKKAGGKVVLKAGTYYLSETLVLTPEDSGTSEDPVVYAAEKDAEAVISGGRVLDLEWKEYKNGIMQAKTPAGLEMDQLFVGGELQRMARYPNYDPQAKYFNGTSPDAVSKERAAIWSNPAGGYIHALHRARWGGHHYLITGKNEDNNLQYEGGWQNNRGHTMHKQYRFVENIFEELDAPGEWYHDEDTQTLYYYPAAGIDLEAAKIVMPRLDQLIEIKGSMENPVVGISLRGLTFRHANRTFMKTREPLLRSDWTIYRGGAVLITGAEDCEIVDCEFDRVGGNAAFVSNYNRNIAVRGSHINGIGASGVCFVGDPDSVRNPSFNYGQRKKYDQISKEPGPKAKNYPVDCIVENSLIHNIGRIEKQVAGVQISMSTGITVRHCSIYETPRAGINVSEGTFGGHLIEYCDVFDTVLETGDHGSFNSWGRDRFWHLKGAPQDELRELAALDTETTIIRNSRWRCDHGWDIDLDDGSSHYRIYNNLLLNGGLKFREGFDRLAENNIMVKNTFHPHVWYKDSGDIFRRNIVFTDYRPIRVPKPWGQEVDYNLKHESGVTNSRPAVKLQQQSGRDKHSIVADARFVDPSSGDYRVEKGSPALKMGFENFPMDKFGVQKPELKAMARTPRLPVVKQASDKRGQKSALAEQTRTYSWQGVFLRGLSGEEYSAFGVAKESGGLQVLKVAPDSPAARAGLEKNDLIMEINGQQMKTVGDLRKVRSVEEFSVNYVRSQKQKSTTLQDPVLIEFVSEDVEPLKDTLNPSRIGMSGKSFNEPASVLCNGKLEKNYGPVYRNGMVGESYVLELQEPTDVKKVHTFSYNHSGRRGQQVYTLYAFTGKWVPVMTVDSRGIDMDQFLQTTVTIAGDGIENCSKLRWQVYPPNGFENTAYQELQVESTDDNS